VWTTAHPLFGRERDVAALETFAAQAAGDGGAVLVTGEAGVGKTAVVDVVAAGARQRGVRVRRVRGGPGHVAVVGTSG
jgi:predicted ATPase